MPWWFVKPNAFDVTNLEGQNNEIEKQKGMNILQRMLYHRTLKKQLEQLEKRRQKFFERDQAMLKERLKEIGITDAEKTRIQGVINKNDERYVAETEKRKAEKLAEKKEGTTEEMLRKREDEQEEV